MHFTDMMVGLWVVVFYLGGHKGELTVSKRPNTNQQHISNLFMSYPYCTPNWTLMWTHCPNLTGVRTVARASAWNPEAAVSLINGSGNVLLGLDWRFMFIFRTFHVILIIVTCFHRSVRHLPTSLSMWGCCWHAVNLLFLSLRIM